METQMGYFAQNAMIIIAAAVGGPLLGVATWILGQ